MVRKADTSGRVQEVEAIFFERYKETQYAYVQFLTEHLADLSRVFAGDLQQMLVLALIGQAQINAVLSGNAGAGKSLSASRIADVSGIPRETVRRKLTALEDNGWIERDDAQRWQLRMSDGFASARAALNDLDRRAIARIARLFCQLESITSDRGRS